MISALVNLETNVVENIIVADPAVHPTPSGYLMVSSPPEFVAIGTKWDGRAFVAPPSPPASKSNPAPKVKGLSTL